MKKMLLALLIILPTYVFGHAGHDQPPGVLKSFYGGVVQSGVELNLEVIIIKNEVSLYPVAHEGESIEGKTIKVEAVAHPRKGAPYNLVLVKEKEAYKTTVDLKGASRLPIKVSITTNGKTDHFKVQVED